MSDNKDVFIEVKSSTSEAAASLENLKNKLKQLDNAAKLKNFDNAVTKIEQLSETMTKLDGIARTLERIGNIDLSPVTERMQEMVSIMAGIGNIPSNLQNLQYSVSAMNSIVSGFKGIDMAQLSDFSTYIWRILDALNPLFGVTDKLTVLLNVMTHLPSFAKRVQEFSEALLTKNGPNSYIEAGKGLEKIYKVLYKFQDVEFDFTDAIDAIEALSETIEQLVIDMNSLSISADIDADKMPDNVFGDETPVELFHNRLTQINNLLENVKGTKFLNNIEAIKKAIGSLSTVTDTEGFASFTEKIRESGIELQKYTGYFSEHLRSLRATLKEITPTKVVESLNLFKKSYREVISGLSSDKLQLFEDLYEKLDKLKRLSFKRVSNQLLVFKDGIVGLAAISKVKVGGFTGVLQFLYLLDTKFAPTLGSVADKLKKLNLKDAIPVMLDIQEMLAPLKDYRSQAGGLINALKNIDYVVERVNALGKDPVIFDELKTNLRKLAEAFEELNTVSARIGATIKALEKIPDITVEFAKLGKVMETINVEDGLGNSSSKDISRLTVFAENINTLSEALKPLENVKSRIGGTIKALTQLDTTVRIVNKVVSGNAKSQERFELFKQNMSVLVKALEPISSIGKSGFGSIITQLRKLPEVMDLINNIDTQKLEQFIARINRLARALEPLASQFKTISAGINSMSSKLGKLAVRLNSTDGRVIKSTQSFDRFHKALNVGRLMSYYFFAKRIGDMFARFITESNAYVENLNLFRVAMGAGTNSLEEFMRVSDKAIEDAKVISEALGIDPSSFMRYQGTFKMIASGFGMASKNAAILSKNMTQLGYDISSLYNISIDSAMEKLQAGLTGITRPLRELGIDLSEVALREQALALGIQKSVRTMTQAEKAELRYITLLKQTSAAQGDMARTLITPANALRILKEQFNILNRAIGNLLNPLITKFVPYMIAFTKVLNRAINELAVLVGFVEEGPDIDYDSAIGGLEGIGDGAEEAQKKVSNLINGLDEFKSLNPKSDDILGGTLGIDLDNLQYDMLVKGMDATLVELEERFNKSYEQMKETLNKTIGSFDSFGNQISIISKLIVSVLITNSIHKLISSFGLLGGEVGKIGKVFVKFGTILKTTLTNPLFIIIALLTFMYFTNENFRNSINNLIRVLEGNFLKVLGAVTKLVALLADALAKVLMPIAELLSFVIDLFVALDDLTGGMASTVLGAIALVAVFNNLIKPILFVNSALMSSAAAGGVVKLSFAEVLVKVKLLIVEFAKMAWALIKQVASSLLAAAKATLQFIAQLYATALSATVTTLAVAALALAVGNLALNWDKMSGAEKFVNILLAVAAAATIAAIAIAGFQSAWTLGIGAVAIAAGIAAITMSIRRSNAEAQQMASGIKGYAKGGVVEPKSLFYADERGNPELVANVGGKTSVANNDMIVQAIENAAYKGFVRAIQEQTKNGQDEVLVRFEMDDGQMARALTPRVIREAKRTGFKIDRV